MLNHFDPEKFYDHRIVNDKSGVVGHIRVKPSGILWAPKNAKKWYGVSLDAFATFMEKNGNTQKK